MSSASSAVTYTSVYTDSEPGRVFWGADEELSDDGSLRVIVYGYNGLPIQPPHDPDYVPEPMYPEYIPLEDEHVFPAEEQPLPPVVSPTAESPGYVVESVQRGARREDEERGGEALSTGDSTFVCTLLFLSGFRHSISLPPARLKRLLAIACSTTNTTYLISPPYVWDPPSALIGHRPHSAHSSPPPVPSPLLPSSGCLTQIQTLGIASTQALVDAVIAALPSPPLPPLPPSLYIPPPVDRRDDIPEFERPPCKRSCLFSLGPKYEVGESSTARPTEGRGVDYGFVSTLDAEERRRGIREVGYGIRDTWVDPVEVVPEIAPMTVREVNTRVTKLAELHEHDTQDLYALLKDAQDSRTHIL
ncbi:hypothetical protein Tco_0959955 [Tanacetum coccineum]